MNRNPIQPSANQDSSNTQSITSWALGMLGIIVNEPTESGLTRPRDIYSIPTPLSAKGSLDFGELAFSGTLLKDHHPKRSTPEDLKICSTDQSEEFEWTLPLGPNSHESKTVMLRRESLRALMGEEQAQEIFTRYYNAYSRCFPNPNEVESKEALHQLLERGKGDWDIGMISMGEQIIAGYHTKLARISALDLGIFSIGDYLWADKTFRRSGLGKLLYSKTMELRRSQGAQGHFGEIRDINLLPAEELARDARAGTRAKDRIGFWKTQERMALDAPWFQPPLGPGKEEVDFYMLTVSKLTDECPSAFPREAYLEIWKKFYPLHKDSPSFDKLKELTEDTPLIRLIPIDEPRTFIRQARDFT